MIIGIDLGSTQCAIAAAGAVQAANGRHLPAADVTILPTPQGWLTFPSVVCPLPDDPSHLAAGEAAESAAGDGNPTIPFPITRLGLDVPLDDANGAAFTPHDAAVALLRHLRESAEATLGDAAVTGAVIAHPAWFDARATDALRRAAAEAGLARVELIHADTAVGATRRVEAPDSIDEMVLHVQVDAYAAEVVLMQRQGDALTAVGLDREPAPTDPAGDPRPYPLEEYEEVLRAAGKRAATVCVRLAQACGMRPADLGAVIATGPLADDRQVTGRLRKALATRVDVTDASARVAAGAALVAATLPATADAPADDFDARAIPVPLESHEAIGVSEGAIPLIDDEPVFRSEPAPISEDSLALSDDRPVPFTDDALSSNDEPMRIELAEPEQGGDGGLTFRDREESEPQELSLSSNSRADDADHRDHERAAHADNDVTPVVMEEIVPVSDGPSAVAAEPLSSAEVTSTYAGMNPMAYDPAAPGDEHVALIDGPASAPEPDAPIEPLRADTLPLLERDDPAEAVVADERLSISDAATLDEPPTLEVDEPARFDEPVPTLADLSADRGERLTADAESVTVSELPADTLAPTSDAPLVTGHAAADVEQAMPFAAEAPPITLDTPSVVATPVAEEPPTPIADDDVLARPVSIYTAGGLRVVFENGTAAPAARRLTFPRPTDPEEAFAVSVFSGDAHAGNVHVDGLAFLDAADERETVELTLYLDSIRRLRARATVGTPDARVDLGQVGELRLDTTR